MKNLTRWKKISNGSEEKFSTVRNLRTYGWKEIFHKGKFSSDRRKIESPPLSLKIDDWKLQFSINGNAVKNLNIYFQKQNNYED